jgi:hypothetical protein
VGFEEHRLTISNCMYGQDFSKVRPSSHPIIKESLGVEVWGGTISRPQGRARR